MRVTKELLVKIIQEELDEIQGDMKFRQPGGADTDALVKKMQDKEDSQKNFDPLQGFRFNKNDNLMKKLNTVNGLVEELLTTNDKKLVLNCRFEFSLKHSHIFSQKRENSNPNKNPFQ